MRDHVRPYAGEAAPQAQATRDDPALDATFANLEADMQGGPHGVTLWMQFHAQVRMAQVARDAMCDRYANQLQRDFAATTYGRHCDRMMDLLAVMSSQQLLVQIGTLLNRRDR